jgi:hypothetical protein
MINHKFENIRVGDRLYSLLHGEITITEILNRDPYPVRGRALDGDTNQFFSWTFGGKSLRGDLNRDLYWERPEIIEKPRKKIQGWVILMQDRKGDIRPSTILYKTSEIALADANSNGCKAIGDPVYMEGYL